MIPISIEDLPLHLNVLPPKRIKLPGRLKTKRIRKGAWNRQARKYGNCKQPGYNIRRCISYPIAKNKHREQVYDWVGIGNNDDLSESEISQLRSGDFKGIDIRSIGSSEGGGSDTSNSDMIIVVIVTTLASPLLWERMGTNMSLNMAMLIGRPEGY